MLCIVVKRAIQNGFTVVSLLTQRCHNPSLINGQRLICLLTAQLVYIVCRLFKVGYLHMGNYTQFFSFSIAGRNTQLKYKCITVQVKIILFCNGDSRLNIFCKDSDSFTAVYNYTREICQEKRGHYLA